MTSHSRGFGWKLVNACSAVWQKEGIDPLKGIASNPNCAGRESYSWGREGFVLNEACAVGIEAKNSQCLEPAPWWQTHVMHLYLGQK